MSIMADINLDPGPASPQGLAEHMTIRYTRNLSTQNTNPTGSTSNTLN